MARNSTTTESTTTATKRPRKSAEEKAVAELDAAEKTLTLAEKKLAKLKQGMEPAQVAFDKAEARVRFLQQNPDLPEDRRQSVPADVPPTEDNNTPDINNVPL